MPTDLVMRSTGSRYLVRGDDGTLHECVAKGNLRIKGWKSTNPVAVGDRVDFSPQEDADHPGAITDLHDRRNYLVRRSVNLSHHKHVIAANLDQALLIVTVARPRTSTGFIDRFLVTAEAFQVPVVLVVNKVDDLADDENRRLPTAYCQPQSANRLPYSKHLTRNPTLPPLCQFRFGPEFGIEDTFLETRWQYFCQLVPPVALMSSGSFCR